MERIYKFIVLHGSPKGDVSVTMQFVRFLQFRFKEHSFEVINISSNIKSIENGGIESIIDRMNKADGIIWAYPVYHFVVPAQYVRFIELLYDNRDKLDLQNKYATALSPSIHFYDNLAEDYIRDISADLGLQYVRGFLAAKNDLLIESKQTNLTKFFKRFTHHIDQNWTVENLAIKAEIPAKIKFPMHFDGTQRVLTDKKFLLITDATEENNNLFNMVKYCTQKMSSNLKVVNLNHINVNGGCRGCLRCGARGDCVINDELRSIIEGDLISADGIIIATTIKTRYISSLMKTLWDRSFLHGHIPIYNNKSILYLCSGSYTPFIKNEFEARINVFGGNLIGVIHDNVSCDQLLKQLNSSIENLIYSTERSIEVPRNFLGVAGHKIFRDYVYLAKSVFRAGHEYFKKTNYYDFPQTSWITKIKVAILMLKLKYRPIDQKFQSKINDGMIREIKKVVDKMSA